MKRASSFVAAAIVPAVIAFVLTARPARLYAESAPRTPECSELDITSCEGKADGAPCGDGTADYRCQQAYCIVPDDAGVSSFRNKSVCARYYPPPPPASSNPQLGVPIADGNAAQGSGTGDDGGCSTAGGGDGGRAWAAALGLFVMATAIKRRLRKR